MPNQETTRTLSVRLLKEGRAPDSVLKIAYAPDGGKGSIRQYSWTSIDDALLFVGQLYTKPPSWLPFIEEHMVEHPDEIISSGAGAVLVLPVRGRTMAICFGHIHIALDEEAFERHFGLKVTLNSVPRDGIRTLDLATPDAVTFQKRVQASKDSDIQDFGVDMLRDLARVAGGTPSNSDFAKFLAGRDSLSITCRVSSVGLQDKCEEILDAYVSEAYKEDFAWVDNMQSVRDNDTIQVLNDRLFEALQTLRAGGESDLHMAPPEVVDYEEGCLLHYNGFGGSGATFHSLSIEDYVAELNRCDFRGGIDEVREKHYIKAKTGTSETFNVGWKVYQCFTFETTLEDSGQESSYVLFSGNWYRIEQSFKEQIEARYEQIPKVVIIGPTTCNNERELIAHLEETRPDLLCLDQVKINPGGVRNANIEPCDFLSEAKEFIHLKDGHSSGPISHLWAQGIVSAEALVSDSEFRKKLRREVNQRRPGSLPLLPAIHGRVARAEYTVVYGIMRKPYKDGSIGIPFFSKVSLQAAADRLEQLDLPMALEIIQKPAGEVAAQEVDE
ncbi:DUF6119 family protein [Pseudomonas multiresinivorans]|uniref:Sporadically distributed protein, TIGR04141 family n=1 Tax=Pseudomonas multiresinivorans TaxID=95301 RepID=A0A7Z3GRI6_9PSED|nr:DUF6119 family protein [Pseudomonas multiresinivorans]QJP09976.1 sporadically distributed protein, TIGR04141 family [Pseudomonas multiresinivorans]